MSINSPVLVEGDFLVAGGTIDISGGNNADFMVAGRFNITGSSTWTDSDDFFILGKSGQAAEVNIDITFDVADDIKLVTTFPLLCGTGGAIGADELNLLEGATLAQICDTFTVMGACCGCCGTTGTGPTPLFTPLPVEFIFFSAKYQNGTVLLKWATATEITNSHFEIERSLDAQTFEIIGFMQGQAILKNALIINISIRRHKILGVKLSITG